MRHPRLFVQSTALICSLLLFAACGDSDHNTVVPSATPTATATPTSAPQAEACVNSGGTVTTGLCCGGVPDFPNTCGIGACGCAPGSSHTIQKCNCADSKCFDGTTCVTR